MTRFEQEYSGALGNYWRESARKEIERLQAKADAGEILVDENGAASWKSNGRALPADCAEKLSYTTLDFSLEATAAKRDEETCKEADEAETAEAIAAYRRNHRTTEEERMEMQAAFGKGTTVVDIISGAQIRL